MKKNLVTKGEIAPYICQETQTFHVDESMILTPGAKDELSRRGIAIVCEPKPEVAPCVAPAEPCCNGLEELLVAVAALVKAEFGVEDPELIKAISLEAVKTINENI